jgi:hypothetical protein
VSLLTLPGASLADWDNLDRSISDEVLRLSHCANCTESEEGEEGEESESQSAPDTSSAKAGSTDIGDISTKELSQQSANPIGQFAYIFTQFAATFNNGDDNNNDHMIGSEVVFQPIIPIPVLGEGEDEWRIVTRPTVSLLFQQPVPKGGVDNFDRDTGLSDLLIPLPLALPESIAGNWLLAAGPSFSLPTATDDDFGRQQWAAGVSGVFGYISENWMTGAYPQYYWRVADQGRDNDDVRQASFGNMFYWYFYNVTDSLQIGWNPTIKYDNKAESGNKWNVPFGFTIAKITKFSGSPIRIEVGAEFSVVKEDDFGEVARLKFNIIPVIPRPIKSPLFGK